MLLVGGGGIALLAYQRRPPANEPSGGSAVRPSANALQNAGNLLRHKLLGENCAPSKFRVGMMLALGPTPFILAGGIKLPQPGGSNTISMSAVGHVSSGNTRLLQLCLPDGCSIGWPEFQAKDGKTYAHAWMPGSGRVPPRVLTETRRSAAIAFIRNLVSVRADRAVNSAIEAIVRWDSRRL